MRPYLYVAAPLPVACVGSLGERYMSRVSLIDTQLSLSLPVM